MKLPFLIFIMKKIKLIIWVLVGLIFISTIAIYVCDTLIKTNAKGKLYSNVNAIPYNRVGLLLGTAKYTKRRGFDNPYYTNRIKAATALLKAGKIKYLIVSGDNGREEYNEPEMMREDLIKAGIDSTRIYLDYAGFRTFDSMVRLKEVFGQDSVTVISQLFHNERAFYIASKEGIVANGFNARDARVEGIMLREKLARVNVFVDYLIGTKPKFLGKKVELPD
jgi:SanA protein